MTSHKKEEKKAGFLHLSFFWWLWCFAGLVIAKSQPKQPPLEVVSECVFVPFVFLPFANKNIGPLAVLDFKASPNPAIMEAKLKIFKICPSLAVVLSSSHWLCLGLVILEL